ncbi:WD-repeat containing protein SWD2 [Aspergillus clavatus NRRL 1]|uniref:WD repeat protein n=1 Tax=Aspergillus clavatus (strain ATCC 1007 / CBS 513.65 / DSM 816 / NCTC 3887 / NRRL 1 / QM 1276 / 107) TaxID=344612 RepID=A1CBI3_ASPCL|nr:WD repeat protein [Aspergillus clavatus NRRL 1]EAW13101.1 WD repeat protein [Aspergillus clavatus NRRL 1]
MAEGQQQPQQLAQQSQPQALMQSQKVSDIIRSFHPAKAFKGSKHEPSNYVTSLDFDDQGDYLVASGDDETIQVFDIKEGKSTKSVPSKKYGVHLARFTHHSRQILHASTKVDDSLRLLDLHNEGYVRYFSGHTDKVTCLALSPGSDTFISCSKDDTIALWDLSSRNAQGKLKLATPYLVAFDPSASVIAIASQSTSSVLLYDFRNYDKAPFSTFDLAPYEERYTPSTRGRAWTRLEFSNDGKHLIVGTDYHGHFVLDAFEGNLKAFLVGKNGSPGRAAPVSTTGKPLGQGDVCFTPDGRYAIGGSGDHTDVLVWDLQQTPDANSLLQPMTRLTNRGRTAILEYNPRYNMLATADKEVVFWLPEESQRSLEK